MLDVKQTLKDAEERMESAILYLDEELAHIRAGRANVAILDAVRVDSYGSKVPLNQVATVSTPGARTIAIRPWDRKAIRDIEKAIMDSDVGVTPENNGEVIRLNLPQPTGERRKELVKQSNKIGERTKVEIRNVPSRTASPRTTRRTPSSTSRSCTTSISSRPKNSSLPRRRRS